MYDKCEICGCSSDLKEVYFCACDKESPSATLCEKCKKKYFDYVLPNILGITPYLQSVTYIKNWSFAENLVHGYNVRFGESDKIVPKFKTGTNPKKETTTMQVTYNGVTGDFVKLEKSYDLIRNGENPYVLTIFDSKNLVTHTFSGIKLEDVKFSGGAVTFAE